MFQAGVYRKLKLTFHFQLRFSEKSCRVWDNVEKILNSQTRYRWHNMAHAHCMLDTQGYKWTLRICNTYSFSTATIVAWTHLSLRYTCIACLASSVSTYRYESFSLRAATNCVWQMSAVLTILHPPAIIFISYLLTYYNFVSTPLPTSSVHSQGYLLKFRFTL